MMTIRMVSLETAVKRLLLDTEYIAWEKNRKGKTKETKKLVNSLLIRIIIAHF